MDPQRARLEEDLRGLVSGEVRCDEVFVQLYASDASVFQIKPLGVVRPRSASDVQACVRYAAENRLPLHARGAGTGLAGESLGGGVVLDFSCHMRRVLEIGEDSVRVQPGVVLERLNSQLRAHGRFFGPDPAMAGVTTMGSVASVDSGGSHWLRYGSARRHVRAMQVVLADGTAIDAGREPLVRGRSEDPNERKRALIDGLVEILARNAEAIVRHAPKSLVNRCGYRLQGVLAPDSLDLASLLVGSEGTLALFTEITLGTSPLPRHRGLALLLFDSLDSATRAVLEIAPLRPAACDLMDRRHLSLARQADSRYDSMIPGVTEALLLVEEQGDDAEAVRERLRDMVDLIRRQRRLAFDSRQTFSPEEIQLWSQLSQRVVPTLYRVKGSTRGLPFIEDMAVPVEALPRFVVDMQNILKKHQVTATLFAHAGHGQLHLRPFLDPEDPEHIRTLKALASDLYEAVFEVEGTISGEHADGLSRTPFVRRQYGELYEVFREIKRAFDPENILNPGKKVADLPVVLGDRLRPPVFPHDRVAASPETAPATAPEVVVDGAAVQLSPLQLQWAPAELAHVSKSCNGCGACRTQDSATRMCPIFRFAPSEEASPRAKANLLRGLLSGELDPKLVQSEEFKDVVDLCVNCQMCRLECPAGVDIPKLMLEAKAEFVAVNGLKVGDWVTTRLDSFASLGSLLAPLANWALANRQARWLLEKIGGIAQGRKLPRFAARGFIRRAHRRRLTRPARKAGRKVVYFVDTYANYFDPQLAEALVAILEHCGVSVFVPPEQTQSGMSMVSLGAVERARRVASRNVAVLAEAIRQGYTVVCSEPSAALCLTREYLALLDDEDTRLVAANTQEAGLYLRNLHQQGKLPLDFRPVNATVGYHLPCHLKALEAGDPGYDLLRLIPGLTVVRTEKGCSGMAGTWGLKKENYRSSLKAGWPLISSVRESTWQAGSTECSACKMQMEQGSTKPVIHPLKLLALSYGLMPEAARLLTARGRDLVVT